MNNKVNKRKLKIIKQFFLRMKDSLDDLDYWQKENESGVVDLVKEHIKEDFKIAKIPLEY
ncbi:TPA: hypothetical protein K8N12_003029 [Clostridium perfringens]|nr:hypothetical protein [Clostridium perfringens]